MNLPKSYVVILEDKRIYGINVEAYSEDAAKEVAHDIYLHEGPASEFVSELQINARCTSVTQQSNESTDHAAR